MCKNEMPYTLRVVENAEGVEQYYICFKDGQSIKREIEVDHFTFTELLKLIRKKQIHTNIYGCTVTLNIIPESGVGTNIETIKRLMLGVQTKVYRKENMRR